MALAPRGFESGRCLSVAPHVRGYEPKNGVTAAGGRSCCLSFQILSTIIFCFWTPCVVSYRVHHFSCLPWSRVQRVFEGLQNEAHDLRVEHLKVG